MVKVAQNKIAYFKCQYAEPNTCAVNGTYGPCFTGKYAHNKLFNATGKPKLT
jgi:hypothetical protein